MKSRCLSLNPARVPRSMLAGIVWLSGLAAGPQSSLAAEPWSESFEVRAGAVTLDIDSSFRIDSRRLGRGTTLDAEDQLGLDDEDTVSRVELGWRFAPRHQFSAGYFDLSRDARTLTEAEFQVGNVIFPQGIAVATDFELSLVDFSYSYSLVQTDRFELAPLVGLYWMDFDVSIASESIGLREEDSEQFPLPTVGVSAIYQLSPEWRIRGRAQYFSFSYDDYKGEIVEFGAALEWSAWSRFRLGAGYSRIDLDVENKESNGGRGAYLYDGIWAYLGIVF